MIEKDPVALLEYTLDFDDLDENGNSYLGDDQIDTDSVSVTVDAGLTLVSFLPTGTTVQIWLSGGELGQTYKVKTTFMTLAGRRDKRSFRVVMKDK